MRIKRFLDNDFKNKKPFFLFGSANAIIDDYDKYIEDFINWDYPYKLAIIKANVLAEYPNLKYIESSPFVLITD